MDKLEIEGGVPLRGEVTVSGAKNAVLPILAATLLADGPCVLEGVPDLRDLDTMIRILRELGVEVETRRRRHRHHRGRGRLAVPRALRARQDDARLDLRPRAPPRRGASAPRCRFPGGCVIGPRPDRPPRRRPRGARRRPARRGRLHPRGRPQDGGPRDLPGRGLRARPSRAPANVLMAAVLTPGTTVIEHAACEPEVADLARFLVAMGAKIEGIGGPAPRGDGRRSPHAAPATGSSPTASRPGTFMTAAAITHGDVVAPGRRRLPPDGRHRDARAHGRHASSAGPARRSRVTRARAHPRPPTSSPCPTRASRPTSRPSSWRPSAVADGNSLRHREDLPRALHPRRRAPAHARPDPQGGPDGHRGGGRLPLGRARDGLRPPRLGGPRGRRASPPAGRRPSTASTTSTAATSASRRSSPRSARASAASPTGRPPPTTDRARAGSDGLGGAVRGDGPGGPEGAAERPGQRVGAAPAGMVQSAVSAAPPGSRPRGGARAAWVFGPRSGRSSLAAVAPRRPRPPRPELPPRPCSTSLAQRFASPLRRPRPRGQAHREEHRRRDPRGADGAARGRRQPQGRARRSSTASSEKAVGLDARSTGVAPGRPVRQGRPRRARRAARRRAAAHPLERPRPHRLHDGGPPGHGQDDHLRQARAATSARRRARSPSSSRPT